MEAYDPTSDTWTTKASMSTVRFWWPGAGVLDGRLYVVGGWGQNVGPLGTVEVYDATSNTWSAAASTPTVHGAGLIVGVVNSLLYAVGGFSNTYLATNEAYQP